MKELFKDFKDNEIKYEVKAQQDQRKEIKLVASDRKIPGLTLWEYNQNTGKLQKAKFKTDETLELKSLSVNPEQLRKSNKVIINENCIYFQALNERSARKKLKS
jgi:hypothetical protein